MELSAAALAVISLTTTAVGAGVSFYAQHQQAKAVEDAAEFNARIAEQEAKQKEQVALENMRRQRRNTRRFLSRQRALFAGRGIAMEGTALEIMGQSKSALDMQINDALWSANNAINLSQSQAAKSRYDGSQMAGAQRTRAYGTLLSGASSFGSSYYNFKDQGAL